MKTIQDVYTWLTKEIEDSNVRLVAAKDCLNDNSSDMWDLAYAEGYIVAENLHLYIIKEMSDELEADFNYR